MHPRRRGLAAIGGAVSVCLIAASVLTPGRAIQAEAVASSTYPLSQSYTNDTSLSALLGGSGASGAAALAGVQVSTDTAPIPLPTEPSDPLSPVTLGIASSDPFRTDIPDAAMMARLAGILQFARGFVGHPYVWGGTTPAGFDCSGLVQYSYAQFGILLPRTAEEQYHAVNQITRDQAQPGDLVFFPRASDGFIYHVAIYVGGGLIVEARNPTVGVVLDSIWQSDVKFGTVRNLGHRPGGPILTRYPASTDGQTVTDPI